MLQKNIYPLQLAYIQAGLIMSLPRIENANVKDKKIFLLTDIGMAFNNHGSISDDTQIKLCIPTIEFLLARGATVIVSSHLGDKNSAKNLSLEQAAPMLGKHLNKEVSVIGGTPAEFGPKLTTMAAGSVVLLDNLARHSSELNGKGEFAAKLNEYIDIFVNDAFGASAHSYSTTSHLPQLYESFAGFTLFQAVDSLNSFLAQRAKPLVVVLGGVELGRKIPFLKKILRNIDSLLLGGGIAYTFLKARAIQIGASLVEQDLQVEAFQIIEKGELEKVEIALPDDHVIADNFSQKAKFKSVAKNAIPDSWQAVDISSKTLSRFEKIIKKAGTVLFYGPLGVIENDKSRKGSLGVLKAMSKSKAMTIVMGQDSLKTLNEAGLLEKITHPISSSSAAMDYLQGNPLPGLQALTK